MVIFTEQAERDLEEIADFIAVDNPARALTFVRELREKAVAIEQSPRAFPLAPRHEDKGLRRRIHGNYVICYRLEGVDVVIIHILHVARDIHAVLSSEE